MTYDHRKLPDVKRSPLEPPSPEPPSFLPLPRPPLVNLPDSPFSDCSVTEPPCLRVPLTDLTKQPPHTPLTLSTEKLEPLMPSMTNPMPHTLTAKRPSWPNPPSVWQSSLLTLTRSNGSTSVTNSPDTCTKPVVPSEDLPPVPTKRRPPLLSSKQLKPLTSLPHVRTKTHAWPPPRPPLLPLMRLSPLFEQLPCMTEAC